MFLPAFPRVVVGEWVLSFDLELLTSTSPLYPSGDLDLPNDFNGVNNWPVYSDCFSANSIDAPSRLDFPRGTLQGLLSRDFITWSGASREIYS